MTLQLGPLSAQDMPRILEWRRAAQDTLRTPYSATLEQQLEFYRTVVCNRDSPHKYWALYQSGCADPPVHKRVLVGMGGLINLSWENRHAEISLLIDPARSRQGLGTAAVRALLQMGFGRMGLATIWGECYESNDAAVAFWRQIVASYPGSKDGTLYRRQQLHGRLWDAYYFALVPSAVVYAL